MTRPRAEWQTRGAGVATAKRLNLVKRTHLARSWVSYNYYHVEYCVLYNLSYVEYCVSYNLFYVEYCVLYNLSYVEYCVLWCLLYNNAY